MWFIFLKEALKSFAKSYQVLINSSNLRTVWESFSQSKTQTKLLSGPHLTLTLTACQTSKAMKQILINRVISPVGVSSDVSVFSVHESVFISPSEHHLACTEKQNKTLCGSCFNQLPDCSNKPCFISFAELKLFQYFWWIHQQQNYVWNSQPIIWNKENANITVTI